MLDVAFINLISAGIERLCRRADSSPEGPVPAVEAGELISSLTAIAPGPTRQLIEHCVSVLWQHSQQVGLPAELTEPHIAALPEILSKATLSNADRALFLAEAETVPAGAITELSARIIAAHPDDSLPSDLDETVLSYLLEAFLGGLLATPGLLQTILPLAHEILAAPKPPPPPAPEKTSDATVTLAKIERADALGISVPLLEVITVTLINLRRSADLRHDDLVMAAAEAVSIDETLDKLAEFAPERGEQLGHALSVYRAGRLDECNRLLAGVEDRFIKLSIDVSPRDIRLANLALAVRAIRAAVHGLEGAFVKAARCYGFAQRYISRSDIGVRWRFAKLEADHYELAAYYRGSAGALENAARACTSALATMPADEPSTTRAAAQTGLAAILALLGERDQEPARFELAAQLLADAHTCYDEAQPNSEAWTRAVTLRADVLTRLGELHRSRDILEQAAVIYQSLITADPPEQRAGSTEGTHLRTRLALALFSFIGLQVGAEPSEAAMTTIVNELPNILAYQAPYNQTSFTNSILAARCHNAIAQANFARNDLDAAAEQLALAALRYEAIGFYDRASKLISGAATPASSTQVAGLTDNEANAA